jgi:hypothetical protein
MSSSQQSSPAGAAARIKHFYLGSAESTGSGNYLPRLYFEARIDFSDVRSGLRETVGAGYAVEILPFDDEMRWTTDMVFPVDSTMLVAGIPDHPRLQAVPAYLDDSVLRTGETRFLEFLLRFYKLRVLRNFSLNVYSRPGDSREAFEARCVELLNEPFHRDMDHLGEIYQRKLDQIKEKHLKPRDWSDMLHHASERVAQLFLNVELTLAPVTETQDSVSASISELEERLVSLEWEAHKDIQRLLAAYQERARNVDEYIIHPCFKDIHLARTCILWMPVEAESR